LEPLSILAGAALTAAVVLYVVQPVLAARRQIALPDTRAASRRLQESKDQLLSTLKELEFDHRLGKLSDTDYQQLRTEVEGKALRVMEQLDEDASRSQSPGVRAQIEAEVAARRSGSADELVQPPASCSSCGAPRATADRFCAACGNRHE
jgi:hypothetical protein